MFSIVNQIKNGEFEAKLNATQVLKDLIDSNKNFSFKDAGIQRELFEIIESTDPLSQRCSFSVLDSLYTKVNFSVKREDEEF